MKLEQSLGEIAGGVVDIQLALRDGYQPHDEPTILEGCRTIVLGLAGGEDVVLDLVVMRRTLTSGRQAALDKRVLARERRLRALEQDLRFDRSEKERATSAGRCTGGSESKVA